MSSGVTEMPSDPFPVIPRDRSSRRRNDRSPAAGAYMRPAFTLDAAFAHRSPGGCDGCSSRSDAVA